MNCEMRPKYSKATVFTKIRLIYFLKALTPVCTALLLLKTILPCFNLEEWFQVKHHPTKVGLAGISLSSVRQVGGSGGGVAQVYDTGLSHRSITHGGHTRLP